MRPIHFIIILIAIFIAWLSLFGTALNQDARIQHILSNHTSTIQTVENNQHTNATAIKDYIACLLDLNPTQTPVQIKAAELSCFDNAPQVK